MGRILSVNPEFFRLDIREAHDIHSTTEPRRAASFRSGSKSSLEPSITSSSAHRNDLTCFSPEKGKANILSYSKPVPGTKGRILKRDSIFNLFSRLE